MLPTEQLLLVLENPQTPRTGPDTTVFLRATVPVLLASWCLTKDADPAEKGARHRKCLRDSGSHSECRFEACKLRRSVDTKHRICRCQSDTRNQQPASAVEPDCLSNSRCCLTFFLLKVVHTIQLESVDWRKSSPPVAGSLVEARSADESLIETYRAIRPSSERVLMEVAIKALSKYPRTWSTRRVVKNNH